MDSALFGVIAPRKTALSAIDPRIKIIATALLITAVAITLNIAGYAVLSVALVGLLVLGRMSFSELKTNILPFLLIALFTFILHLIFSQEGDGKAISILFFSTDKHAIVTGFLYAWRILLFFSVAILLALTTGPMDLADGLVSLFSPLERIGIRVDHAGLMIFLSFRFIPLLMEEYRSIQAAMISRGLKTGGGPVRRLKNLTPLLTAVLSSAIRRAGQMASALEARGFNPDRRRTSIALMKIGAKDIAGLAIIIVITGVAILLDMYA